LRIEDYALIGNTHTAALVGRNGSIDWWCVPRFDSGACFAALLGDRENGRWLLAPCDTAAKTTRSYREETLILETTHETANGTVRVLDFMPVGGRPVIARLVEGVRGRVRLRCELVLRFDYGSVVPWVRRVDRRLVAVAGPDAVQFESTIELKGEGMSSVAEFEVAAGERTSLCLAWFPSHEPAPISTAVTTALEETEQFWRDWVARGRDTGCYREAIVRSLITLKALTYSPTGGMVAAVTASLPELVGGNRNWDYRFCWLRDSTFTLYALVHGGYGEEARAFRDWLLRAVAGDPGKLQICYGLSGERRLDELELPWLAGYENSRPVRVGNAAAGQLQLDVYGEVGDTLHQARRYGIDSDALAWAFQRAHTEWIAENWRSPDQGLWEMRSKPRHFTHSKVLAWVALDRAVKAIEEQGLDGPLEHWREVRAEIHASVCRYGFDRAKNSFTQSYGSSDLDASLLLIPAVGFLDPRDERVLGTIAAIERELLRDGFVQRYETSEGENKDGLSGIEGAFLACSFWLVDAYALSGQMDKGRALFERLLSLCNDVGLLAEEYDPVRKRQIGNFPQAFSHVALINSARNLSQSGAPGEHRRST